MNLIIDHRKQRQMPKVGPWVFWRQHSRDEPRLGLVLAIFSCSAPACECRAVKIEARKVDDSLRRAELANKRLIFEFDGGSSGSRVDGSEVLHADLDIDSGELFPAEGDPNPELAQWLQEQIDGEALDLLHDGWLANKRLAGVETHVSEPILATVPGDMVPWQEVFPMARQDVYVTPDGAFEVIDSHCIAAACRCQHAAVQILRGDDCVANVLYEFRHNRVESEELIDLTQEALDEVWSLYCRRYRVASRLADHSKQVKAQAARVRQEASRRSTVKQAGKVGRNEPCPCGSSKKYKRCCLKG